MLHSWTIATSSRQQWEYWVGGVVERVCRPSEASAWHQARPTPIVRSGHGHGVAGHMADGVPAALRWPEMIVLNRSLAHDRPTNRGDLIPEATVIGL